MLKDFIPIFCADLNELIANGERCALFQDPSYNSGKFGEIKELILGMLDTYNYEKVRWLDTQSAARPHRSF